MEQMDLDRWSDFKPVIDEIRKKYGYHEYTYEGDKTEKEKNTVLFRGQQCSDWPLLTTLERQSNKKFAVSQYIYKAIKIIHEIESYMGNKWGIQPNYSALLKEIHDKQDNLFGPFIPYYDYLVYLRHHGYPSPLLDWSTSPYIAAYFALCNECSADRIAIYAYVETIDQIKSSDGGPIINVKGPFVSTHKRHFIQKAWYTIATKWSKADNQHIFCSHHEIFNKTNKRSQENILIKITLPIAERKSVLKDLDEYNINHFTLFQTEDSLIKALAMGIRL